MRCFQQIASGVDVLPLLHAIQVQPKLWNMHSLRTMYPQSPHHEAEDIWIRFNPLSDDPLSMANDRDCVNYEAFHALPQVRPIIFDLMRRVEAEQLGRVIVTKLAPGKQITPHEDAGAPATYYERYHILLQNHPGSLFYCGDEAVCMKPGEVWWFDNTQMHSVVNNSKDDRLTMIVDVRVCR